MVFAVSVQMDRLRAHLRLRFRCDFVSQLLLPACRYLVMSKRTYEYENLVSFVFQVQMSVHSISCLVVLSADSFVVMPSGGYCDICITSAGHQES